MVDVAQLVEHWIVAPVVAGSSPVLHPFNRVDCFLLATTGADSDGLWSAGAQFQLSFSKR